MNKLKKIISIFLVVVVLSTTFLVPIAHAEVITVTTVAGVAAVVAAAAACGYVIANNGDFSAAASAFANDFIRVAGDSWNTLRIIAEAGGKVVAHWGAQLWNTFTNWLQGVVNGSNVITFGGFPTALPTSSVGFTQVSSLTTGVWNSFGVLKVYNNYNASVSYKIALSNGEFPSRTISDAFTRYATFSSTIYYIDNAFGIATGVTAEMNPAMSVGFIGLAYGNATVLGHALQFYNVNNDIYATVDGAPSNSIFIVSGYESVTAYIGACINAGRFIGRWGELGWGEDVINPSSGRPRVGIDEGANTLGDVGSMPVDIPIGQEVQVPIAGDWLNPSYDEVGHVTREGDVILTGSDTIDIGRDTFVPTEDDYISDQIPETTDFPYPSDITDGVQDGTDVVPVPTTITGETDIPITDTIDGTTDIPIDTDIDIDDATDIPDTDTFPDNPPAEDTQTNTNRMKLSQIIVRKFPFCLPFDLYNSVRMMVAEPEAPVLNWKFKFPFLEHFEQDFEFDFSIFETLASVVRWFLSAIFIVGLIFVTKKIIWK